MTFLEFYKPLLEMPLRLGEVDFGSWDKRPLWQTSSFHTIATFSVNYMTFDVMENSNQEYSNNKQYVIINNEQMVGKYSGIAKGANGITTESTQAKPVLKGDSLMFHFYINFLLPKFKKVQSDSGLSDKGFNFYKRNFQRFIDAGYSLYITQHDKVIKHVNNPEELHNYWGIRGSETVGYDYRFLITK